MNIVIILTYSPYTPTNPITFTSAIVMVIMNAVINVTATLGLGSRNAVLEKSVSGIHSHIHSYIHIHSHHTSIHTFSHPLSHSLTHPSHHTSTLTHIHSYTSTHITHTSHTHHTYIYSYIRLMNWR